MYIISGHHIWNFYLFLRTYFSDDSSLTFAQGVENKKKKKSFLW